MFRIALVLLTAIAVLWHATAGCCAHHDHAAAPGREATCGCRSHGHCEEAANDDAAPRLAKSEHEGGTDALAHLSHPDDSARDACGERCSFPQPEGSGVSLLKHSLAACDLSLPVATLVGFPILPPAERMRDFDAPPPLHVGHALRRHLALGVLLV